MKKVLVLGALLISGLGFSQTVSGSVWRKVTSTATSQNKRIRRGDQMAICTNLPNTIIVQNTQWPINIEEYGCGGYGDAASWADWGHLLQGMGAINTYYLDAISTDPNNPTPIPISQYSDLLLTLHLTDNSWSPQSFNEQYELHFTINKTTKSICEIGQDSKLLYENGYVCGPENKIADQVSHIESKWVETKGVENIDLFTFQHRKIDYSRIYDQNNNLIWEWNGENIPAITWYEKTHTNVNILGNDKIRLEFSQGYNGFCNGYMKIIKMTCSAQTLGNDDFNKSIVSVYPNPTSDYLNINTDNEVNIKVYDLLGKLIINQYVTKQLSLSELNKGLYMVEVSNNDIQYKTKIIKN